MTVTIIMYLTQFKPFSNEKNKETCIAIQGISCLGQWSVIIQKQNLTTESKLYATIILQLYADLFMRMIILSFLKFQTRTHTNEQLDETALKEHVRPKIMSL